MQFNDRLVESEEKEKLAMQNNPSYDNIHKR